MFPSHALRSSTSGRWLLPETSKTICAGAKLLLRFMLHGRCMLAAGFGRRQDCLDSSGSGDTNGFSLYKSPSSRSLAGHIRLTAPVAQVLESISRCLQMRTASKRRCCWTSMKISSAMLRASACPHARRPSWPGPEPLKPFTVIDSF